MPAAPHASQINVAGLLHGRYRPLQRLAACNRRRNLTVDGAPRALVQLLRKKGSIVLRNEEVSGLNRVSPCSRDADDGAGYAHLSEFDDVFQKALAEVSCGTDRLSTHFRTSNKLTADILAYRGHEDEAVEAYEKLIHLYPEMPELRYSLGMLYRKRAGWDKALEVFQELYERAIELLVAAERRQHVQQDASLSTDASLHLY